MKPLLIVLIGPQGSGKSTFCTLLPEFRRISQDDMGRFQHWAEFRNALASNEDIVLDRTNASKADRGKYISAAKGYDVLAVFFDIPFDICAERIKSRIGHKYSGSDKLRERCYIGLKCWFSRFEKPNDSDFQEVVRVSVQEQKKGSLDEKVRRMWVHRQGG